MDVSTGNTLGSSSATRASSGRWRSRRFDGGGGKTVIDNVINNTGKIEANTIAAPRTA